LLGLEQYQKSYPILVFAILGFWDPGRFRQSWIPGLVAFRFRDFRITKIC